ncbi:olfactory receptor 11L1-like [Ascaphus truei]|uniref:olfactory receptor 11L1-like n=1 Tax=Ascaphus truei TaxID=8439 RepID=UPI003F5ABF5B
MHVNNQTRVMEFLLLGFQNLHNLKILLFILFLVIYVTSLTGNVVIITLVSTQHRLHSPMFFFLGHLSSTEILSTTNIIPQMLYVILAEGGTLSFTACMSQFYIFSALTNAECFLLAVMSYDRFLAICDPLHYTSIMDLRLRLHLVFWSWLSGLMITLIIVILVSKLQFCGPNVINHFFCDLAPILELSCSDTSMVEIQAFLFSIPVILFPFVFITVTYIGITITILRISTTTSRQKAFSTCSSHLAVVCTYYGTLITVYLVPSRGLSLNVNKVLSLLYIVVTPLLNPIIYSLRNQEIKATLGKYLYKSKMQHAA